VLSAYSLIIIIIILVVFLLLLLLLLTKLIVCIVFSRRMDFLPREKLVLLALVKSLRGQSLRISKCVGP